MMIELFGVTFWWPGLLVSAVAIIIALYLRKANRESCQH